MFRANDDFLDGTALADSYDNSRAAQSRMGWGVGALKRGMDIASSALLLLIFLPVFLLVALAVKLTSSGPIFYFQERVGQQGAHFRFWKFRSMVVNSEEVFNSFLDSDEEARSQWEMFQKLDNDPRITRIGHFIRRTSLDELPQLWNVLRGDMSLVGPRPCMPDQRRLYGAHWREYCAVKPGITGLWQVSGRNQLTYEQRVLLDAEYVRKWSLGADFKILARTFLVVATGHGSR
jgi:exopolysaccharide production protein ExoY